MNEKLQQMVDLLPIIRELVDDNSYITVLDSDSILRGYSIPAGTRPQVNIGERFHDPSGAFNEVMRTGNKKYNVLPKEVMGEPFEGVLVPVKDGLAVVGVIIYTHSVKDLSEVRDMTAEFKDAMEKVTSAISEVTNGMESLGGMLAEMNNSTLGIDEDVQNATRVVAKISSNAGNSNILALNASIEAARSGEAGRGFAVVATEMGNLAKDSGNSAKEIQATLDTISQHLHQITSAIQNANKTSKGYLEGVADVKKQLEKTMALANELQKKMK